MLLSGYSIEVTPKNAQKVESFSDLLPQGTRVYVAHIDGTKTEDMVACARRIRHEGFPVMPHIPARLIAGERALQSLLEQYRDAGVDEALVLAGGVSRPHGKFENSMQLLETGLFRSNQFRRIHVAGHPEGNLDIDAKSTSTNADAALLWKQAYADRNSVTMAIVTQFIFEAAPVSEWIARVRALGITMPIHIGIAGPTKLSTLLKFAVACGVGPSMRVLQNRALDLAKLLLPYEPTEILTGLEAHQRAYREHPIEGIHIFPLGGVKASVDWVNAQSMRMTQAPAA